MFRVRRGLLHGLLVFGIVVGLGVAVVLIWPPEDPESFGERVGEFSLLAALAGFGISYLRQTGRSVAAWAAGIVLAVVIVGFAIVEVNVPRTNPTRLTDADRAPLVEQTVGDTVRLVHPTLGFSIQRPPRSFQNAPQFAAMMGGDPGAISYAFAEEPPQALVVVTILSAIDLAETMRGLRRGFEESMKKQLGARAPSIDWVRDEVRDDEGNLHAVIGEVHMQVTAHLLRERSVVVTLMILARDATTLVDVRTSFQRS